MSALALLSELRQRGIEPRLVEGRLKLVGPADALTPALVERAREARDELKHHLMLAEIMPAESVIKTCREHGIQLEVSYEQNDVLIIGDGAWPSLLDAIQAHRRDIIELLRAGFLATDSKPLAAAVAYGDFMRVLRDIDDLDIPAERLADAQQIVAHFRAVIDSCFAERDWIALRDALPCFASEMRGLTR